MSKRRNLSFTIEKILLDQIRRRAEVRNGSFNSEMRSLIRFAVVNDYWSCGQLPVPEGPTLRTVVFLDGDDEQIIREQARAYHRSIGKELVRAFSFALEEVAKRDLAFINSMLSHQSPPAHAPQ